MQPMRPNPRTYFVGSLPGTVHDGELFDYFARVGRVVSLEVIKKRRNSICKGYGFVTLELRISEQEFLSTPHTFQGRRLTIEPYIDGEQLSLKKAEFQHRRLFIKNLPPWVSDADLVAYFSKYGHVEIAYKAKNYDQPNLKPAIGCVHFASAESLDFALAQPEHQIGGQFVKCDRFKEKKSLASGSQKKVSHQPHLKLVTSPKRKSEKPGEIGYYYSNQLRSYEKNRLPYPRIGSSSWSVSFPQSFEDHKAARTGLDQSDPCIQAFLVQKNNRSKILSSAFEAENENIQRIFKIRHQEKGCNVRFNLLRPKGLKPYSGTRASHTPFRR